jgi:predicted MPP superfamily phosphohydrolase
MTAGCIHYHHKYREELTIHTDKPLDKPLTIVLASDLHIGYHNRKGELGRWIDLMNAENPDLVLIGGDIVDRSVRTVLECGFADEFKRLKAPIYTILGNHEYYSDVDGTRKFLSDAGITLLRDSVVELGNLQIVGRDDRTNRRRKPLGALVKDTDAFTILLDHQPYHLEQTEHAGIDFQLSGHTHHGQVWPISWITDFVYECAFGFHQRGDTRYYISSGIGLWGGKFRIGTQSEYVVATIQNESNG